MVRVHPGSFQLLIYECRFRIGSNRKSNRKSAISNQQSQITWLGRQLADHLGLEPGMLWVRIPLELFINTSSRSSPECSPPCQGGDQGFKSPRGRISTTRRGTQSGKAAKLKPSWSVGSTPTRVNCFICVGWALVSSSGCNPPAFRLWRFNSVQTNSLPFSLIAGGPVPIGAS